MTMLTKKKYVVGEHLYLEEKCIQVIEEVLNSFFEVRLKSAYSISELYVKGSLRNLDDILEFLSISNEEIKTLIETMVYRISGEIDYNMSHHAICFNIDNEIEQCKRYIENSVDEFKRTEKVLGFCEKFLDKSLSKIFETYCQSKVINYLFDKSNLPEKILGNHSVKKQKLKHGEVIFEQLTGFILNLKCELRNELVKSTLVLINSIYTYEEISTVA